MIHAGLTSTLILDPTAPLPEALWITILCFLTSIVLLDLFDISLPRGDSIGVSGALCSAALLQFGPLTAIPLCLAALSIAFCIRSGGRSARRVVHGLFSRMMCLLFGTSAMVVTGAWGPYRYPYLVAAAVPAAYLVCELLVAQIGLSVASHRPLIRLVRGNFVVQGPLLIAEWSAAVLLVITVGGMGAWSLIPVVALLLLIRQSYALLLDIRETYRTTVEVLVEAAEGQDPRLAGHAERSAEIARRIAMRIGLSVPQVELVSYAALLHDVDAIRCETAQPGHCATGHSSALFEGVAFFADVLPILRVCDGDIADDGKYSESELLSGLIVALASDADAGESEDVEAVHDGSVVARVAPCVPSTMKATAVSAALSLGYKTPAVS